MLQDDWHLRRIWLQQQSEAASISLCMQLSPHWPVLGSRHRSKQQWWHCHRQSGGSCLHPECIGGVVEARLAGGAAGADGELVAATVVGRQEESDGDDLALGVRDCKEGSRAQPAS